MRSLNEKHTKAADQPEAQKISARIATLIFLKSNLLTIEDELYSGTEGVRVDSGSGSGSILIGCPPYASAEELVANANDLHGWAAAVRKLDPSVRNDGKKRVGEWGALDAYAQEWVPQYE